MSETATLKIGSSELEVTDVDGDERVSSLFRVSIRCRSMHTGPRPKEMAGEVAKLTLFDSFSTRRSLLGVVSRASRSFHPDGSMLYDVEMRPQAWLLTRGRNCRSFQHKTVVDIVSEVLNGVPFRWDTSADYPEHAYVSQYREDNWTFACRLLEQAGIYFWFDHDAQSTLVFGDRSMGAPELVGGSMIEAHDKSGLRRDQEVVEALGRTGRVQPTAFAVRSYNPDNPALEVSGSVGSGALEIYDAPGGGPTEPAEANAVAQRLANAADAERMGVNATTNSVRVYPGRVVAPMGHARLDGRYFVTSTRWELRQRRRNDGTVDRPWVAWFSGLAADTPYVPERRAPLARQAGIQTGRVIGAPGEEIYPNARGDVRVEQHWDRFGAGGDKGGTWMRVAQRGANDSMQLPRMGWNVLTFNEEGAVDAPSVLTRVNDGEHPPAYKLPDNKTRVVFKTATTPADGTFNEIYFEDLKSSEEMFVNASRDMSVLVHRLKSEGVGRDSTRTVGNDHTLTVLDDMAEEVERDQTVTISGNDTLTVAATRAEAVGANLTTTIGGNRKIDVGKSHSDAVAEDRNLTVGAALIDTSLGTISGAGDFVTMLAGGAQLKLSAKSIADAHGGVSVQTIGAAKLEFSGRDRLLDVEKIFYETVGGVSILKTDKNYTDTAETTSRWTVGLSIETTTPELIVRAQDKIELVCGGSSISILPESIEISATSLDASSASVIEAETPVVEHNG